MFKIFTGYQLVEAYHNWKKNHKTDKKTVSRIIRLAIAIIACLVVWCLPVENWIDGMTIIQKRTLAIFLFAILMWLFEAVPAWTTSVMVVVLLLFTTSNSSLVFFNNAAPGVELGDKIPYKDLLHCFADPIIMLFIGGFVLAIAASKTGLDLFLARVMLKPFGKNPKYVLLGFLMVTGIFSMFLSNTATAAMMLTFLGPVLKALPADGKGKTALALAIPIAANIGGMGTPIGTPPNAIALKYMAEKGIEVGFGQWMAFMIPLTLLLLVIAWVMLIKLFPFKAKEITLNIEGELKKDWRSIVVYITFICTVLLWVLDKATGVNANVVAMLPVGVCAIIGVLTKRDLEEISWSVLWMVAGGFALGVALQKTGLAETLIALCGKHHGESAEAQELGLRIVTFMKDKVGEFCEKYRHNYSVLATPAEGLAGRFTRGDKKKFGIIPGITDKDYYTNSNHVPVYYKCTPKHKAEIEAPYHALTGGGHIFYVEIDGDATHNPEAIMTIVDLMDKYDIGYCSVNHNRNRCMDCGFENADENLEKCPHCKSTKIDKLQRITGYLVGTTGRWNSAKLAELKDRVVHK